ncbi:alcohol dehydrogenase catalytic domain-containing protein [Dehalogenimonas sp. THU2]|uniref:alcohol dehydrogenase catalytic domain-containing protein n=1 Tax=Dehalogenimonas sp. THU2 TaxID=3151121 RepID=UPI0032181EA4
MFAVGMIRGREGLQALELPEPVIEEPDDILIRVKEVGLDGTDYNTVKTGADFDAQKNSMVLGHEMTGIVEAVGSAVTRVKEGDLVSAAVRHGCGICHPCRENQSDMCMTGLFTEHGIHKLDGYLTEKVVEKEQYVVKIPPEFSDMAVLTEPISIVEKGIQQIRLIQSRMPWSCSHPEHSFDSPMWGGCKIVLVIGVGPLGLLATALCRLAGATVIAIDIVPPDHPKAELVKYMDAHYLNVKGMSAQEVMSQDILAGQRLDIVFEASGASPIAGELIMYMSRSSIYVMTGIPRKDFKINIDAAQSFGQMVRYNQVLVGSVNSNRNHFLAAVASMPEINRQYPDLARRIITNRFDLADFEKAFTGNDPAHIKTVIRVSG